MMRDLLRPTSLIGHVLVVIVAVTCVLLGQWQLDRLATVRENNLRAAERLEQPPVDLAALADPAATTTVDEADLEYRRVEVAGTFRPDEEVLQRNRSYQNQSGFHLLTPLELTDGGVVLVRRGWVPADLSEPPVVEATPEAGEVTVVGVLERPVGQPPGIGPTDPDEGSLERVFHADTARLDQQIDGELFPMVLRIDAEPSGAVGRDQLPVPAGPPILEEGSHLSYAVQWHAFALIALITYGAWLRTRSRNRGVEGDAGAPGDPPGFEGPGGIDGPDDGTGGRDPDDGPGGGGGGLRPDPEPDRPLTGATL